MIRTFKFVALMLACFFVTSAQSQAKDLLEEIKERGEIVIATEARFAPFEMLKKGKIVGYSKDLLDEILKDLPGVKLKQLDLPYQGILAGLVAKRYDFVCTSLTITKERAARYAFTLPISTASLTIVKRTGDDAIKSAEDMAGKIIGIQAGASPYLTALKNYENEVLKPKTGKGVDKLMEFVSYDDAYAALAGRRVDAVVNTVPNIAPLVKERSDVFEIILPAFGPPAYFAWAGRKDDASKSLIQFFSDGIKKLDDNGKLKELQKKWFGFTMDLPLDSVPEPVN